MEGGDLATATDIAAISECSCRSPQLCLVGFEPRWIRDLRDERGAKRRLIAPQQGVGLMTQAPSSRGHGGASGRAVRDSRNRAAPLAAPTCLSRPAT